MPRTPAFLLVAAASALCSCGGGKASGDHARADSSGGPAAEVAVSDNGVFIDHESCGRGDLTLLFVHGWAIDRTYWSNQVAAFCPEYRVVTMDLAGHGRSGTNRSGWTVEDYAGDVRAVMDQLDLDHVVLIGHSMGGNIVLEAAIDDDRVIALVGVDNFKDVGVEYTDEVRARIAAFVDQLRTSFAATAVAYSRRALFQPTTDSAVVQRVIRSEMGVDSTIAATTFEKVFEYAPRAAGRLSRLHRPLYLINSSASPTDTAGLKATGVRFQLLDVGPTGHYPMIEAPERFNGLLERVLGEVEADARR